MAGVLTLDIASMEERIVQLAMKGGQAGAEYALGRVKARAPVRKIFRGTAYHESGGFRKPRLRQVGFSDPLTGETNRLRGHPNDLQPLFRSRQGNATVFLSGDFRRVDPNHPGRLSKLAPRDITAVTVVGGKAIRQPLSQELSAHQVRVTGGKALTGPGRYEVRTGRANFKDPSSGTTRVGGRLRGELHIEGPFRREGIIWWYIVTRTKERGRLYGRDQEFGNRHTRPHPFLRPGLHESRGPFRKAVKGSIAEGLRKR